MIFKFETINPILHNELRLKIMVALGCLHNADFVYLCQITEASRGNLSVQIRMLQEAGYLDVNKTGFGRFSHTVYTITNRGRKALKEYEDGLRKLFAQEIPAQDENNQPIANIN